MWCSPLTSSGSDHAAGDVTGVVRGAWRGEGRIQPILSAVHPLEAVGEAAYQVHHNLHEGKIGVLCLAPGEGQGIDDPAFRECSANGQIPGRDGEASRLGLAAG
jgi:hypothetical protein